MKNKLPKLVVMLIITLITTIMWISLNIFRAITVKPSPVVPGEISKPLNPVLDTSLLNQINSKLLIDTSQIPEITVVQTPAPTPGKVIIPTVSPTPVSTPQSATASGSL